MTSYTDQVLLYNSGEIRKVGSADSLELTGGLTVGTSLVVSGNAEVSGNLTVQGDIVSSGTSNLQVQDPVINLAVGQTNATALVEGITFNLRRATGTSLWTATAFTAGSTPNAPEITLAGNATADFTLGTIVYVSGASKTQNDGIYAVNAASYNAGPNTTTLLLYGTGGFALPAYVPFCQSQVVTDTGNTASVVSVAMAVLGISDGATVKDSSGASIALGTPVTAFYEPATVAKFDGTGPSTGYSPIGSGTLQSVYSAGASASVTMSNGRNLDINKPSSGTAAITLEANAASDFTVDAANLTLQTTTSGTLALASAGAATFDSASNVTVNSSAGNILVGSNTVAQSINIGTGVASKAISFGNAAGTTSVTLAAGSGLINFGTTARSYSLSGTDAVLFVNNGARLHLGAGATDYFYSDGTRLLSGSPFVSGGYIGFGTAGSDPAPVLGAVYYNTGTSSLRVSDGVAWSNIGGGASTLQGAYNGGPTITLTNAVSLVVNPPVGVGTAGILLNPRGVRSNFTVTDERLDLISSGARAGGLQVLVEATNSAGTAQVFTQAETSAVLRAGASPVYPYYFYANSTSQFVAMEAEMNAGGIYIGSTAHNSFVAIGTDGVRNISIGNLNAGTNVTLYAGTGNIALSTANGGAVAINPLGARSNFTVTNERLDLKSVGSRVAGTQVLVEATNTSGVAQVVAQADTEVLLQAGVSPAYPYYLDIDGVSKFVALEAEDNTGGIYVGSTTHNSFIAIGTDGARNISIGNNNSGTAIVLYAANGVSAQGTLSGNSYVRPGQYATGSLPTGAAGALIYDTTVSQPKWHNGTSWQTFGSLTTVLSLKSSGTSKFSIGHVVRFDSTGTLDKSDASTAGIGREVVGIALDADSALTSQVSTVAGSLVEVLFAASPSVGDEGKPVYLSASTAGTVTLVAPSTPGQRVYRLGVLSSSTVGPNSGYYIIYQPQFVTDL